MKPSSSTFVLSLGGSLLAPSELDVAYLKRLRRFILGWVRRGARFAVITGGGDLNRRYNAATRRAADIRPADLDWIGIATTKLHAQVVRALFGTRAYEHILDNPEHPPKTKRPILVGGGYVPGSSTDLDAVLLAKAWGAKTIINLTNTSHVYDRDPRKDPKAKAHSEMTWTAYRKLIPKRWTPRLSTPFDPVASREAERLGLTVCILNGRDFSSFQRLLKGKSFKGTRIS